MTVLFMGTGSFAGPSLQALLKSKHEVLGVVTQPDRPSGRNREVRITPVKKLAQDAGLPVLQPESVRSEDFINVVRQLDLDVIVVASFGQIVPKAVLDIPRFGSVNVHASLLPKYRGAAPVHYALFEGETVTGVTTMLMDAGLDTGPILLQKEVAVHPDDNQATLEARLADVGAELLLETLEKIHRLTPVPQDGSKATYAPSIKKEDCRVNWEDEAVRITNRVRGCSPKPGAYALWQGSPLKIWSCRVGGESAGEPGLVTVVSADGISVNTGSGEIVLTEVQPENRKRMGAGDFARGYRLMSGARLT